MPVFANPTTFVMTSHIKARAETFKTMTENQRLLAGCQRVTAEILYKMPDHPRILNSYVFQEIDHPDGLPLTLAFIDFWRTSIEGAIARVEYTLSGNLCNFRFAAYEGKLQSPALRRKTM